MEWVLWGSHPAYADGVSIKLTGGTLARCRQERRWRVADGGWTGLDIRRAAS